MGKYTGSQCIICQNLFQDSDNIVVCPDCGTPYHRSCWDSVSRCINTPLHAVGGSWQSQQEEIRRRLGGKVCPQCQFVNAPDAQKCASCDASLADPEDEQNKIRIPMPDGQNIYFDASDLCCGLSPDEPVEEERLGDVANFVGSNTLYYIPLFRRFRDTGRKASLNFSCLFFPYFYFAYRKMWVMAILSGLLFILCGMPTLLLSLLSTLTSDSYMEMIQSLYGEDMTHLYDGLIVFLQSNEALLQSLYVPLYLVNLGMQFLFCLFGNYLYFRFVMKSVGKIRRTAPTLDLRKALLRAEGGTSFWNVLGCLVLYHVVLIVLYTIMALVFM